MATIQDIFDWLNQGAQGDIPGTGGEQPNAPAASQSAPQPTPAAATPQQASPQDFTGGLEPGMLNQYNALVQAGVPPGLAHMILTSDQQQPGQQQQGQQPADKEKKPEGLQASPGYQAGHEAGMGLDQLFFGAPKKQGEVQTAGDLLGFRGYEGDQSSVPNAGAPGGPLGSWMQEQGMDPAMKGYDWGGIPAQRPWLMSPQQPANEASAQQQPGLFDMLSNWFNPPAQQSSDWS